MIKLIHIIRLNIIIAILMISTSFAFTQDRECDVYISNNPVGSGVSVRWIGKQISYQEGISIFRKENNTNWVLLTPSPIMPPKILDNSIELTSRAKSMFDVFTNQSHEEFLNGFGGVFTLIESVKDYNLALAMRIAYNDETAIIGNTYQYKIETKLKGVNTTLGITKAITCQVFSPSLQPDSITVTRKKKGIEVDWINNIDKYFAYDVYQKTGDGEWVLIMDHVTSTSVKNNKPILNKKASPDTAYTFKVCGYDYFGQQSQMSKDFLMDIQDFDPPAIPIVRIDVDSKKMSVSISWSQNTDEDLSHFNIYRSIDPDYFNEPRINKVDIAKTDTFFIDYPEEAGSYYYIIEAVDLSGNVSKSLFVNGTVYDIRPPVAPKYLISRVDTGKLYLNWDANSEKDLQGYRLYRSVADEDNLDNKFVVVNSSIIDTNFYMEPMSKNVRSKFVYQVRALDSNFNVSKASNQVLAQLPDVIAPKAPFIKRTYEVNDTMQIEWMPNVESDLASYNIFKRIKGDTSDFEQLNLYSIPKNVNIYSDVDVIRGQFYEYYLQATDLSNLTSEKSNIALGKLEFIPLSGNIVITKNKVSKIKQELTLEWSADSLINEPIIGYSIHKSFNGGRAKQMGAVSTKQIYKEKLSESGKYGYLITAYGERGNIIKSKLITIEFEKI